MNGSRKKETIAALALLALTGSVVASHSASAEEQAILSQQSEETGALNVLESINTDTDSKEAVDAKLQNAKKLLEEATKRKRLEAGARAPTCG